MLTILWLIGDETSAILTSGSYSLHGEKQSSSVPSRTLLSVVASLVLLQSPNLHSLLYTDALDSTQP